MYPESVSRQNLNHGCIHILYSHRPLYTHEITMLCIQTPYLPKECGVLYKAYLAFPDTDLLMQSVEKDMYSMSI